MQPNETGDGVVPVIAQELRITKTRVSEPSPEQRITLRSEEVRVERVPGREQ